MLILRLRVTALLAIAGVLSGSCGADVVVPSEAEGGGAGVESGGTTATGPAPGVGGAVTGSMNAGGQGGEFSGGGTSGGGGDQPREAAVPCGNAVCAPPEWCLICDPMDKGELDVCVEAFGGTCNDWGKHPPLRMECDGDEDCAAPERCTLYEGSLGTYTECRADDCTGTCTECLGDLVCRTLADCPACATSCEPYTDAGYPVSVCGW